MDFITKLLIVAGKDAILVVCDRLSKKKMEKAMEFVERMRKVQEETRSALIRAQEKMKRQVNRGRKEAKVWKVGDRVILSIKDLVFKERLAKKLVD